jgi:hypothetical protein
MFNAGTAGRAVQARVVCICVQRWMTHHHPHMCWASSPPGRLTSPQGGEAIRAQLDPYERRTGRLHMVQRAASHKASFHLHPGSQRAPSIVSSPEGDDAGLSVTDEAETESSQLGG